MRFNTFSGNLEVYGGCDTIAGGCLKELVNTSHKRSKDNLAVDTMDAKNWTLLSRAIFDLSTTS